MKRLPSVSLEAIMKLLSVCQVYDVVLSFPWNNSLQTALVLPLFLGLEQKGKFWTS